MVKQAPCVGGWARFLAPDCFKCNGLSVCQVFVLGTTLTH